MGFDGFRGVPVYHSCLKAQVEETHLFDGGNVFKHGEGWGRWTRVLSAVATTSVIVAIPTTAIWVTTSVRVASSVLITFTSVISSSDICRIESCKSNIVFTTLVHDNPTIAANNGRRACKQAKGKGYVHCLFHR